MKKWLPIIKQIEQATHSTFNLVDVKAISGGSINSAYRLQSNDVSYFIKLNSTDMLPMFIAEHAGLGEMANCQAMRIPKTIVCGKTEEYSFLTLEYIPLRPGNARSDRMLGQQLAIMHQQRQANFGWHRNNTIGSTQQINDTCNNWTNFWRKHRLGYQLGLALNNGYAGNLQQNGERLSMELNSFFNGYSPQPALLHGDLWSGNAAADAHGKPVIFDPACYYGDREADLAMTELFGGFSANFYAVYNDYYPLDKGYSLRKYLYNLYHVLNHLNLFGQAYLQQAQGLINKLLAELG
jgi:protein-ribulosamine 3-kinase